MKIACFLLLILPSVGFTQTKSPNYAIDGLVTCLHYDTAEVSGPVMVTDSLSDEEILKTVKDDIKYRGNVEFKIGFTSIKCDDAVYNENKKSFSANNVKITCLYYPALKGDKLTYSKDTKLAVLSGHVFIEEKGAEKSIGKIANLDLSHERYVITTLK